MNPRICLSLAALGAGWAFAGCAGAVDLDRLYPSGITREEAALRVGSKRPVASMERPASGTWGDAPDERFMIRDAVIAFQVEKENAVFRCEVFDPPEAHPGPAGVHDYLFFEADDRLIGSARHRPVEERPAEEE